MKCHIFLPLMFFTPLLYAQQAGTIDLAFNPVDTIPFYDISHTQTCAALQSDGKILIADRKIKRLNPDGSLDPAFFINSNLISGDIWDMALQTNGKIIIAGTFNDYYGTPAKSIARLNSDGTADLSFQTGTGFNAGLFAIDIQPDGKILAAGMIQMFNGDSTGFVARLNSDGSRDTAFDASKVLDSGYVYSVVMEPSGKILVGGYFKYLNNNGVLTYNLMRLNADGSRDTTFDIGIGISGEVREVLIQPTGEILVAGYLTHYNFIPIPKGILRLNPDGSRDTTFATPGFDGSSGIYFITKISRQADGKIIAAGGFAGYAGFPSAHMVRINPDGSYDTGFQVGTGFNGYVHDALIQSDGKIFALGEFSIYGIHGAMQVIRLNPDGSRDISFNPTTGFNGGVHTVSILPSGKILAGGYFTSYNNQGIFACAVLDQYGNRDTSFSQYYTDIGSVSSIATQHDGKIVLKGNIYTYPLSSQSITRVYPNGSIDTSFHFASVGQWGTAGRVAIQTADQKIVVEMGGGKLVRLHQDGGLDSAFSMMQVFDDWIWSINVLADGKVLVAGDFTTAQGQGYNGIVRLSPDGTIDSSFNIGSGFKGSGSTGMVMGVAVQDDGKYIVGGKFYSFNGVSKQNIVRINIDGSLDNSFISGTGALGAIQSILIQPDGRIVIGGNLYSYSGVPISGICRLNANGTLDNTFQTGTGFYDYAGPETMALTGDWKIIAGGRFSAYNGIIRNRIARIHANNNTCNTPPAGIALSVSGNVICKDDTITLYRIGGSLPNGGSFKWYAGSCGGTFIGSGDSIQVAPAANILYTLRAESPCGNSVCAIKTIFVNEVNPVITGPYALCQGDTIVLSAAGNYASWLWSTGDTSSSILVTTPGTYTVTVSASGTGCQAADTWIVLAGTAAQVEITGDTIFCSNETTILDTGNYSSFAWSTGSTTQNILVSNAGIYSVVVTDAYGCTGTDAVMVSMNTAPSVTITASGKTEICVGDSVLLSATAGYPSYQWTHNQLPIPGAVNSIWYASIGGRYRCMVTNSNACSDVSGFIPVRVVCIKIDPPGGRAVSTGADSFEVTVFPNPSSGNFLITSNCDGQPLTIFNLHDPTGRELATDKIRMDGFRLAIGSLAPGIYTVTFLCGVVLKSVRLVHIE